VSALARMARRGAAMAGLPSPPYEDRILGAWHWSRGIAMVGAEVDAWSSFILRASDASTVTLAAPGAMNRPGFDTGVGPRFAPDDALQIFPIEMAGAVVLALRWAVDAVGLPAEQIVGTVGRIDPSQNFQRIQYQAGGSVPAAILYSDGLAYVQFIPSSSTPFLRGAAALCRAASGGFTEGAVSYRRTDPSPASDQNGGNIGIEYPTTYPSTQGYIQLGAGSALTLTGTIQAVAVWEGWTQAPTGAEFSTMLDYLEGLP